MAEDVKLDFKHISHDSQTFIRSIYEKPWALDLTLKRGRVKKQKRGNAKKDTKNADENEEKESGSLTLEAYCNKVDDWIVSASMYIVSLPDMSIIGDGKIVGREEDGKWVFKDERIDAMKHNERYLLVVEYDNSDSEKSIQGIVYKCN